VYVNKINKKIIFTFKLSQKSNNLRILYFIKKYLGVGSVVFDKNMASFIIRDKKVLLDKIIPLFDKYSLKTSKIESYIIFKKSLIISNDNSLNLSIRINKILILKEVLIKSLNSNTLSTRGAGKFPEALSINKS
jgi:hypothetical protein